MENIIDFITQYVGTFALLAAVAVPFVVEAFFTYVYQPVNKILNTILVFVISLVVTFAAWKIGGWFGAGFLAEIQVWWHVALYGLGAGAVAKWTWANVETIKLIIQFIINANIKYLQAKRK